MVRLLTSAPWVMRSNPAITFSISSGLDRSNRDWNENIERHYAY